VNTHAQIETCEQFRLQIVSTGDEFAAVAPAWSDLLKETNGSVFQSPDWIAAWWNTLPPNHKHTLRLGLVWHGEALEAVLPLAITPRKGMRFLEWAAIACTDYPDILAAADCPPEKLQQLWSAVVAAGGFDIVQLYRLLPDARMRDVLVTADFKLQPGHRTEISSRVTGDYSSDGGWLAKQSKKARQNYRRGYKILNEGGDVKFRLVDSSTEELAPIVDQFCRLKRKWLVDTNRQSDILEAETGIIQALVDVLCSLGLLRIFLLERNGEIVAISINFEQRGAMMAFLTTFDPAYDRASPGAVLLVDYIQWSVARDLQTVDFLCGSEPFKLRFASTTVSLKSLVGARTLLGHVALFANKVRLFCIRTTKLLTTPTLRKWQRVSLPPDA